MTDRTYIYCPVYVISSPSIPNTLLYRTRGKALEKIDTLLRSHKSIEIHIDYDEDSKLIEGFNEDTQEVE